MKDDFLYENRPPLRKAFSDDLYRCLSTQYPENHLRIGRDAARIRSIKNHFPWQYAVLAFLLMIGLVFTYSGPVRAKTMEWIKRIADFNIEELNGSPIKGFDEGEGRFPSHPTNETSGQGRVPQATSAQLPPTPYPVQIAPVADVIPDPPFPISLPAWVPEGFTLDKNAGIASSQSWISLIWNNADLCEIEMLVEKEYHGYNLPAGESSSEEIVIAGKPGFLVRGFWDGQHRWDFRRGLTLGWIKDGHFYRINYTEREPAHHEIKPIRGDIDAVIDQLIKMAESIQ